MTGSGIDPETGEWSPAFEGQRPPAGEGNALAVTHGAYAVLQLTPRVEVIAEWIRQAADHLTPADEAGVQLLALTLAQLERAGGALGEVDEAIQRGDDIDAYLGRMESRARLSRDARAWTEAARKLLHELGLTPAGRAELEDRTLTVVHVHEVQVVLNAWNRGRPSSCRTGVGLRSWRRWTRRCGARCRTWCSSGRPSSCRRRGKATVADGDVGELSEEEWARRLEERVLQLLDAIVAKQRALDAARRQRLLAELDDLADDLGEEVSS